MSDPYNSVGAQMSATPPSISQAVRPPAPHPIDLLDVSDRWKRRFHLIERAGGVEMTQFRELPMRERMWLNYNLLAFLFGVIYLACKGLWKQAISYLVLVLTVVWLVELAGFPNFTRAVGLGFAALMATRANVSYYQRKVLGHTPWF
ncbi:MAG TPA: DUF2628 domain-containing protein [Stenotrophomonas sp.]|jgi:hypothetical protein